MSKELSHLQRSIIQVKREDKRFLAQEASKKAAEERQKASLESLQRRRYEFLTQPRILEPIKVGARVFEQEFPGTYIAAVMPTDPEVIPVLELVVPTLYGLKERDVAEYKLYFWSLSERGSEFSGIVIEPWKFVRYYSRIAQASAHPIEGIESVIDLKLGVLYKELPAPSYRKPLYGDRLDRFKVEMLEDERSIGVYSYGYPQIGGSGSVNILFPDKF